MSIDVSEIRFYKEQDAENDCVIITPDFLILEKSFLEFGQKVGSCHRYETKAFTPLEIYEHIKKEHCLYVNENLYNEIKELLKGCLINDLPDNYCVIAIYLKGKLDSFYNRHDINKYANLVIRELNAIEEVSVNLLVKNKTASLDISKISFSNPLESKSIVISKKILKDINFKESISKALIEYCKDHPLNSGSKEDRLKQFEVKRSNIPIAKLRREFAKSMVTYIKDYSDCSPKQKKSRQVQSVLIGFYYILFNILKQDNYFKKDPHADINPLLYRSVIKDIQRK